MDRQDLQTNRLSMKSNIVNSQGNASYVIFRHGPLFSAYFTNHARCVDVFVEDEHAYKATSTARVSKPA